jgi:hypothetical protein
MVDDSVMTLKSASGGVRAEFSYRGKKTYHVTLPTFQTQPVFADRTLIAPLLNTLRDGALATHFDVILYTILPDRVVLLIHGRTDESDMKEFLAAFRGAAAAALEGGLGHRLWKRTYLERMLRRGEKPEHCVREIARLPVGAGLAAWPGGYEFTGSFVTDVATLIAPRRSLQHGGSGERRNPQGRRSVGRGGASEGRSYSTGRRPFAPAGAPDARTSRQGERAPDRAQGFERRQKPGGFRPAGGQPRPEGSRPPQARRTPQGGRPFGQRRSPGGQRGPEGHRPPAGRRPGFKPGPRRTGGRPPTSPRGKPRR